jgi:hypothetical protein
VNTRRLDADVSLATTALVALALYAAWSRAGRPRGIAQAVAEGEHADQATSR